MTRKYRKKKNTNMQAKGNEQTFARVGKYLAFTGFGFPDRYSCKLKYVQKISFSGSVTPSNQVFRLDSLYDPDLTGTGHQPRYFDQLAGLYQRYLVTRCDWRLQFINANSNTATIAVAATDSDVSILPPDELAELTYSKRRILGLNSGPGRTLITGSIALAELHGQPNRDSDPDMYSLVTASPQDQGYLTIGVNSLDGGSNAGVNMEATLIYHAVFKDRTEPSSSLSRSFRPSNGPEQAVLTDIEETLPHILTPQQMAKRKGIPTTPTMSFGRVQKESDSTVRVPRS